MNAQTPFVQRAETPASRRHRPPEQGPGSSRAAGLCAFSRERLAPRSRSRESRAHGEARWRSRRPWASLQDPAPPARDVSLLPSGKPAVRVTGPRREHFTGRRERRAHRERGSVDAPRNAEPEPGASPASSSRPAPGPPLRLGRRGLCRCGRAAGPGPGRSRADGPRPRPRARHAVWLGQGDWGGAALGTRRSVSLLLIRVGRATAGAARGHWLSVLPRAGGSRAPLLVQNEAAARHVSSAGPLANETAWAEARACRTLLLPVSPALDPLSDPCGFPTKQVPPLRCCTGGNGSGTRGFAHGPVRQGGPGLSPCPLTLRPEARSSGGPWEPACPGRASAAGVRAALGHLFLSPLGHAGFIPRFPAVSVGR